MGSSNRSTFVGGAGFADKNHAEQWQDAAGTGAEAYRDKGAGRGLERADHTVAVLAQAIQHEIIPRLMLAHRNPIECAVPPDRVPVTLSAQEIEVFGQLILGHDVEKALACITSMRAQGAPIESIYLDLLAPAARYLGQLWEDDLCDFTDVTLGLGRLQKMLRDLNSEFEKFRNPEPNGLSILLVPTPGEQHTFGLAMVAEFFRKTGWEVVGGPYDLEDSPQTLVKSRNFDVVGFSLATLINVPNLTGCIAEVRALSKNKGVCIMVGGPLFAQHPECQASVGADLMVNDASEAPALARLHLSAGLTLQ